MWSLFPFFAIDKMCRFQGLLSPQGPISLQLRQVSHVPMDPTIWNSDTRNTVGAVFGIQLTEELRKIAHISL